MDSAPRRPVGWRSLPPELQQMIIRFVLPTYVTCTLFELQTYFGRSRSQDHQTASSAGLSPYRANQERGFFTSTLEIYAALASLPEVREVAQAELDRFNLVVRPRLRDTPVSHFEQSTYLHKWYGPERGLCISYFDRIRDAMLSKTMCKWDGPVLPLPLRCLHIEHVNHWCIKIQPRSCDGPAALIYDPSNVTYLHLNATIKVLPTLDFDSVDWQVAHLCGPRLPILEYATIFASPAKEWLARAETRLRDIAPTLKENALDRNSSRLAVEDRLALQEEGCPLIDEGHLLAIHAACHVPRKHRELHDKETGEVWTLSGFRGGRFAKEFVQSREHENQWGPTPEQKWRWSKLMKDARCRGAMDAARELEVKINWGKGKIGENAAAPAGRVCQVPWVLL